MTAGSAGRLAAVVAAVCLAGCRAGTASSTSASGPANGHGGVPLVAGTTGSVVVGVDRVPTTLNDHTVAGDTAATRAVASMVWAQVFQTAPGVAPKLDTNVVQSAELVSVAPQTVVYQIDPRAVWSDGTPITAQDFVYAWLSQSGPGRDVDGSLDSVAAPGGYRDIASVTGSDNGKTVTVVFQTPFADWPSLFDDLLPAHVADRAGWNHGFDHFDPSVLLSAGPFVVTSWDPGRQITLGRNPRWWGLPATIDQVTLQAMTGAPSMADALRAGSAQVAYPAAFDGAVEAAVSSSPQLQSSTALGTTVLQLVFNTHRAPLDVAEVRQGIAHGIDRAALVSTLVQPLAPLVWEDNDHLFANSEAWYEDDATGYEQPDPAAAARLLAAGGLTTDAVGTWSAHGTPVVLHFVWAADDPWSALVAPALAAQLVAAGFDVVSSPTSSASLAGSVLPGGAFDVALEPLDTGPYPSHQAAAFAPAAAAGAPSTDWSGLEDPHLDALFTQAAGELAADQDRQLYRQIDSALWTSMPSLPLFAEPTLVAWSASLTGVHADPGGLGPLWEVGRWAELVPASTTTSTGARKGP